MASPKSSIHDLVNLPTSDDNVTKGSPAADNNPLPADSEHSGEYSLSEDDLLQELDWLPNLPTDDDDMDLHHIDGPEARPNPKLTHKPIVRALAASFDQVDSLTTRKRAKRDPKPDREATPRRCSHCSAEKTPQWRVGPAGPGTLCNACGVRYKSGRLVPEYRPAASPMLDPERHSNSHRKIMLRKQKDGGESTAAAEGSAV